MLQRRLPCSEILSEVLERALHREGRHTAQTAERSLQHRLAEIFRQMDNQIIQESKVAFLKIQSWQFAVRTPEIGATYLREAASMITQSLLSFVPNSFVLSEEGYFVKPIEN